jgi:hypothetical protein
VYDCRHWGAFLVDNQVPVTIRNLIGGTVMVAVYRGEERQTVVTDAGELLTYSAEVFGRCRPPRYGQR